MMSTLYYGAQLDSLLSSLQLKLVTGSYSCVKSFRLLDTQVGRRFFVRSYFLYKRYLEDFSFHLVRRRPELFRGGHVIDVGANIGYTATVFAKALDPGFRVYAFEPEDVNFEMFSEMLRLSPVEERIVPVHAAVGAADGTVELAHNDTHPADHRIITEASSPLEDSKTSSFVPLRSIDSFVREHNLDGSIRFMKIDVQGYEPAVCWGMEQTLADNPECTVVLEYCPSAIAGLGFKPDELLRWFQAKDYYVHTLRKDGMVLPFVPASRDSSAYGDLLFSRQCLLN
jgi:FkbM family methyltransferase